MGPQAKAGLNQDKTTLTKPFATLQFFRLLAGSSRGQNVVCRDYFVQASPNLAATNFKLLEY